jgi:glutaminyl-tRNA synthetase
LNDDPTYYGLAPNKAVGLKFQGGNLVCDEVIKGEGGKVISLKCHLDNSEERPKPKSYITWVPSNGISAEIRVYNHLFSVAEPTDRWEEELNPDSEILYPNAILDPSVMELVDAKQVGEWTSNNALQLERIGYFVVDMDTTFDPSTQTGKVVLNRTVNLKADAVKVKRSDKEVQALEARKLKTQQDNAAKEARMQIAPEQLFQQAEEYKGLYSKYDATTGIPTHLADGTELTKSAMKKLAKEKAKHEKALAKYKK